ncbi:MAG TPA: tetratricopeptide repeat protein [Rhodanobacteraceae bacterium]
MNAPGDDAALAALITRLQQGDAAGAEALARRARERFPASAEAARLHGVALLLLGRTDAARTALEAAVGLDPASVDARSNLASAMLATGDTGAAIALMQQVVSDRPDAAALHNNLGNALHAAGDDVRARDAYLAALRLEPAHVGAALNLAAVELALGRLDAAEAHVRGVLVRQPHPQAWLLLGNVLRQRRAFADAEAAYLRGAELAPDAAGFPYQAGLMADELQHYTEAARRYRRALQLDPGLHLAEGQLLFVLRRLCDWDAAAPLSARIRARVAAGDGSVDPFAFLAETASPAEQLACAHAHATRVEQAIPAVQRAPPARSPRAGRAPLRVGFVSAGFHAHATALLAAAMLEHLGARHDLELHLFATTPDDGSDVRRRLRAAAHVFHAAVAQPAADLARAIAAVGIDVLIDVDGWCAGGMPEAFARRPAPVQASWLAYPGTSGAAFIDYLIADRFLIPAASQGFYSEAIAYLPRCYQPSDPTRRISSPPPRRAFGLPDAAAVFASFNSAWKLNAASFARMCRVLAAVPRSVLWLLDAGGEADVRLRAAAARHGIDPARLVFASPLPHLDHLARLTHADLFLDTNPYNAHTTASDAIWAGCPVLTRPGDTFASRVAGSLNHFLGLPELNAQDDQAFIATATRLGNDAAARASLRAKLARQRDASGLFDMRAYANDFAALLHAMAERRRQGLLPATLAATPGAT